MKILTGERIGKGTSLMVGCAAVVFDSPKRERILLTRRADNGNETTEYRWFTPDQIRSMDLVEHHPQRIADALQDRPQAFIR